jgi:hypothetical protein
MFATTFTFRALSRHFYPKQTCNEYNCQKKIPPSNKKYLKLVVEGVVWALGIPTDAY